MTMFSTAFARTFMAAALIVFCVNAWATTILFSDDFNRPDSATVGNGWGESSTSGDMVSIAGNRLQVTKGSPGVNLDGAIYRPFPHTAGIIISGNVEWIDANPNASPFVAVNGLPNWHPKGLKLLFYGDVGEIVLENDSVAVQVTPFVFDLNVAYNFEWIIEADYATELRLWTASGLRPAVASATSPAVTVSVLADPYLVFGAAGGAGSPSYPGYEIRIDNVQVASTVPLPATGSLLLIGLGLLFSTARANNRASRDEPGLL